MRVSVTEVQTFLRCPQKWHLTSFNRLGLEPLMKAPALNLGTLIHQTKETWATQLYIDGLVDVDPVAIYNEHANAMMEQTVMRYTNSVGVPPHGAELIQLNEAIQLGRAMVSNYRDYWGTPLPTDMRLIKAEQGIVVPIPGTDHELEGTLDGLLLHERTGVYYILENKTFAAHPSIQELQRNFQFLCYIWAARQFFQQDVRGLAYDGLWKRKHVPLDAKGNPRAKTGGGRYTQDDLFLRATLLRGQRELDRLPVMLADTVHHMATAYMPGDGMAMPVRVVPPVRGCVMDCKEHILLCDTIWRSESTDGILKRYGKRERTPTFVEADDD